MPNLLISSGKALYHNGRLLYWPGAAANGHSRGHGGLSAAAAGHWRPGKSNGSCVLSATATVLQLRSSASLPGVGVLTATALISGIQESATISGHGALSAVANSTVAARTAAAFGSGVLTAAARMYQIRGSATLAGVGQLSATVTSRLSPAPHLQGRGRLRATTQIIMYPAYDHTGAGNVFGGANHTSWLHTSTAGAAVIVAIIGGDVNGDAPTVTYGGHAMTQIAFIGVDNQPSFAGVWMFKYLNAPGGRQFVYAAFPGAASGSCGSVSYTGAIAVTPTTSYDNAVTTSFSAICSTHQMIVNAFGAINVISSTTGGVNRVNTYEGSRNGLAINDATATTTFSATQDTIVSDEYWGAIGVVLTQAPTVPITGVTGSIPGTGVLTTTQPYPHFLRPANPSARGVLSAAIYSLAPITLPGSGVLSAAVRIFQTRVAAPLHASGVLAATVRVPNAPRVPLTASGVLSATARMFQIREPGVLQVAGRLSVAITSRLDPTPHTQAHGLLRATTQIATFPAYDATGAGNTVSGVSSISWLHTTTAGATLYAVVAGGETSAGTDSPSVTYAGNTMTQIAFVGIDNNFANGAGALWLFEYDNTPFGQHTVTATFPTAALAAANSVSYTGETTGAITTTFQTGSSDTKSLTCTTHQMLLQIFGAENQILSYSGGTGRFIESDPSSFGLAISDAAVSTTFTATQDTTFNQEWAAFGVVLTQMLTPPITGIASSVSGVGVSSAAAYARSPASASPHSHGTLSAATIPRALITATPSSHGVLAATGVAKQFRFTAAATGQGVLAASTSSNSRQPIVSGHGVLTATAKATKFVFTSALSGRGALTATVILTPTLSAHGVLLAKVTLKPRLAASGVLSATARMFQIRETAALPGAGRLSASLVVILPPAFDAVGGGFGLDTIRTNPSFTHVAAAGADVFVYANSDNNDTLTATYDGVSMTLITRIGLNNNAALNGVLQCFKITNVTGGSATIAISGFASGGSGVANSISYTGVTTITTPATVFGSSTSFSQTATCSTGQVAVQGFGSFVNGAPLTYAGGTNRTSEIDPNNNCALDISDTYATTTFTATPHASTAWAGVDFALQGIVKVIPALTSLGALSVTTKQIFKTIAASTSLGALSATTKQISKPQPTGLGALSATTKQISKPQPTGHGALSATVTPSLHVNSHGSGALSAAARMSQIRESAPLSGRGALSGVLGASAKLSGNGTLTATSFAKFTKTAASSGRGALTATAKATKFTLTAALSSHGALSATATAKFTSASALPAHGALSVTTMAKFALAAALPGLGAVTATAKAKFTLAAALPGHGLLTATAVINGPTFDVVGTGVAVSSTTASETHTATAGAAILAFVAAAGTNTISGVTCGGVAMTSIGSVIGFDGGSTGRLYLYKLASAPGGAQTITATFTGTSAIVVESISYKHVTTIGTPVTTGGATFQLTQAMTCSSNQVITHAFSALKAVTYSSGGVERAGKTFSSTLGMDVADATASATFTASTASSGNWAGIGVVLS